jgi:hypothetical protein
MTPYAAMLLDYALADDAAVSARFRTLAAPEHPDARGGAPGPQWYGFTAAYSAVKSAVARDRWRTAQTARSGGCKACNGWGVVILGAKRRVRVCEGCKGEGRIIDPPRGKK